MSAVMKQRGTNVLACENCGATLDTGAIRAQRGRCRTCKTDYHLLVYPRAFQSEQGAAPKPLAEEGQSACYQHPDAQAEQVCGQCGRYMCGQCDITSIGGHVCPICLEQAYRDPNNHRLRTNYPRMDRLVLRLSLLPFVAMAILFILAVLIATASPAMNDIGFIFGFGFGGFVGLAFFTAPVTLILGFFAWNRSYNPIRTIRGPVIAAMIIAGIQFGLILFFFLVLILEGMAV